MRKTRKENPLRVRLLVRRPGRKRKGRETAVELPPFLKEMAVKNRWDQWDLQVRELRGEDFAPYMRLQEVLAAFEHLAVRHFLAGRTPEQRARRAAALEKRLRAILRETLGVDGICPIGYCECDGMCLPCGLCFEKA